MEPKTQTLKSLSDGKAMQYDQENTSIYLVWVYAVVKQRTKWVKFGQMVTNILHVLCTFRSDSHSRQRELIDLIHKWLPIHYSFVLEQISLPSPHCHVLNWKEFLL